MAETPAVLLYRDGLTLAMQKLDRLQRLAGYGKIIRDLDGSILLPASV